MPVETYGVKLGFQGSEFRRGIQESRRDIANFKRDVEATNSRFDKLRNALGALGAGAFMRGVVERADQIKDLSDKFGIFSESLQKVGLVAEQEGSSLESVAGAMNKLEIARDKALSGDAQLIENFRELGITLEDLGAMTADQLMEKIGQSSMNAAPLVAVLGKNALELRNTLAQLEGANVQGIIRDEDVQRLGAFKDEVTSIWRTLQQWGAAIGGTFISAIQDASAMAASFVEGVKSKLGGGEFMSAMKKAYADARNFETWRIGESGPRSMIRDEEERRAPEMKSFDTALKREIEAKEKWEDSIQESVDKELMKEREKLKERAGMSGQELAQDKLDERREKLAQARADRAFERKYGAEALKELKDRQDPVKQAHAAYKEAMSKTETELSAIKTQLANANTTLSNMEAPQN